MALTSPLQAEHQLDQLAGQLEHWRQTRSQAGAHIPEPLWAQAVALAAVLPPTRVAKQLRVKIAHLRRRLAAPPPLGAPASPRSFVEVPLPLAALPGHGSLAVEFQRPDGARLHLNASDTPLPLLALVQCFLEGRTCSN
jgi:hypothetical protein